MHGGESKEIIADSYFNNLYNMLLAEAGEAPAPSAPPTPQTNNNQQPTNNNRNTNSEKDLERQELEILEKFDAENSQDDPHTYSEKLLELEKKQQFKTNKALTRISNLKCAQFKKLIDSNGAFVIYFVDCYTGIKEYWR